MFTINSLKFDGKIHRIWKAEVVEAKNDILILKGIFEETVNHQKLGVIRCGTISYEFYWTNRWYNIFRFHEPDGELRNYYCNINKPPVIENDNLSYVDLDVDVLVWKDFTFEILDIDEFEENAVKFSYSPELREKVGESLDKVLQLIKDRDFPFDFKI